MNDENYSTAIERIQTLLIIINKTAEENNKLQPVFKLQSIPSLTFTCYEAGFLRIVSWLYMVFYEAGRADTIFLLEKMKGFELDKDGIYKDYYKLIHALRTNLQHSMNFQNQRNDALKQATELWFIKQIHISYPRTSAEWRKCLRMLLIEALSLFEAMEKMVQIIISDDDSKQLILSWNQDASHFHEPSDFDQIIYNVAHEIGIQIDVVKHRNKYFELWTKKIEVLPAGYDFESEARKMVQKTLLEDPPIPVTTSEIMKELKITAGPIVGYYLKQAKQLYFDSPCSREQLLERLKTVSLPN